MYASIIPLSDCLALSLFCSLWNIVHTKNSLKEVNPAHHRTLSTSPSRGLFVPRPSHFLRTLRGHSSTLQPQFFPIAMPLVFFTRTETDHILMIRHWILIMLKQAKGIKARVHLPESSPVEDFGQSISPSRFTHYRPGFSAKQ